MTLYDAGGRRLSIGLGGSGWVLFWLVLVPVPTVLGAMTILVGLDGDGDAALAAVPLGIATLVLALLVVSTGVVWYQNAFWLRGTTLVQRRIRGERRWDLSTATITAGTYGSGVAYSRGPALFISAPGGRPVKLGLRRPDPPYGITPPADLLALADAISRNRPYEPHIHAIVNELRQRATSPFGPGGVV